MSRSLRILRAPALFALACALFLSLPSAVQAQPFGAWLNFSGTGSATTGNGYFEVPSSPALNPTDVVTIEGWFTTANTTGCRSLIGKNYTQTYWVGLCVVSGKLTLRSYLRGASSSKDGGVVTPNEWTHFAVTFDGTTRKHYLNGELVASFADAGGLSTGSDPVRIAGDTQWAYSPSGAINLFRFWHAARTEAQIRGTINVGILPAQPGLVAEWLGAGLTDPIGGHNGTLHGTFSVGTFPVAPDCSTSSTFLCLDDRFAISTEWRTGDPNTGTHGIGTVAPCGTADSGLFWFFDPSNWEVLVKQVDACGLNDRHWIFSASTTNVAYRMTVLDVTEGVQKIYFNYPGPPAPAVTDTDAFATCP